MKSSTVRMTALAAATAVSLGVASTILPSLAATFGQREVEQNRFIAVAAPVGTQSHQLLIIEQVSDSRACWSEAGSNPALVEPLLLNFDFTGICSRSTDSNGYSIRMAGEDLGLRYSLRVVNRQGDLVLIGAPGSRSQPEIEIGRANGTASGFTKLNLSPGWRFTKRTYADRTLGHVYLTSDSSVPVGQPTPTPTPSPGPSPAPSPSPTPSPAPSPSPSPSPAFRDISNDIYAQEIQQAVQLGFIAGFPEDNTFRPQASLTREQLVSIVVGALQTIPNTNLPVPTQASSSPFRDVAANRWSAARIQFARDNNIVSGYQDGNFRPGQPVTRAELMAVMRRTAEYGRSLRQLSATLPQTQAPTTFSDTTGHWAASLISQMSGYCRVASPVNERGTAFTPNSPALRNYATAATLRMINCVKNAQS